MSFFIRYRGSFRACVNSWRLSVSFFTSCWSYRSTFSTSGRSFCMSFFVSCWLSCFRTSSYRRSWGLSMSFFSGACCRSRCNFSVNFFSIRSWRLSMSFFTSCRCSFCMCFRTSSNSWSWRLSMSFTSSRLIYYRSCRLFSITSCWSSWSITCLICWFRFIFTSSTIICINHEVRI